MPIETISAEELENFEANVEDDNNR